MVHEEAIASQSPALEALMRGKMSESASRVVTWGDIDRATFVDLRNSHIQETIRSQK